MEADLIVRLRDGRWAAIEVKLGQKQIDEAAENLLALNAKIDVEKMGKASFLMIITGGQFAYQRKDGVWTTLIIGYFTIDYQLVRFQLRTKLRTEQITDN